MKNIFVILSLFFSAALFAQLVSTQKTYAFLKILDNYFINGGRTFLEYLMEDANITNYKRFLDNTHNPPSSFTKKGSSCISVCPENMEILKFNSSNLLQNESNTLSFLNQPAHFNELMRYDFGFCWGHARTTTQLRFLARFDPENKYKTTAYPKFSKEWTTLIRQNLNFVAANQPRVFPYLKSIRELSELFTDDLKKQVIRNWSSNAISVENYFSTYENKIQYSKSDLMKMINELEVRLALGQEPEVLFSLWGSQRWIHVVLVKKISYDDFFKTYTLYLDDNKQFNNISTMLEPSTLVIDLKNQAITYPKAEKYDQRTAVGRMELTQSNYQMYNSVLPRLVNFCKKITKCL